MIRARLIIPTLATVVCYASVIAQYQATGTSDYSLSNSSVMWIPRSSALFLNPGELARLHQNEFLVTSGRFRSLESMSAGVFEPFIGTFGVGVSSLDTSYIYSAGYGRLIDRYSTVGASLSVSSNVKAGFRFSFGGSYHLPFGSKESGILAGLSITNLPTKGIINAGAGYWVVPNFLRIQLATQTRTERAAFLGADVKVMEGIHVQAGSRGFEKLTGGFSYATSYAVVELGAGQQGISFTMNVRFGDAASDIHDEEYDQATEAYSDQRYGEAAQRYQLAYQYDEYDIGSKSLAQQSQQVLDSSITALMQQARENEEKKDFQVAMRAYATILRMNPQQSTAASKLSNIEGKLTAFVRQLLLTGDSLRGLNEITRARKAYALALEFDPENDSASSRIDDLENLSKENVKSVLARGKTFLNRNQLDEAQKEFERVLSIEPKNSQARTGLTAVRNRRVKDSVAKGIAAYESGKYFDAMSIFSGVLKDDEENKDAKMYVEKIRDALKSETDRLFKTGLQFYIKEDYKAAIAEWDKVLLIQPHDSSTIEYRKRAEEKLKALEQFK